MVPSESFSWRSRAWLYSIQHLLASTTANEVNATIKSLTWPQPSLSNPTGPGWEFHERMKSKWDQSHPAVNALRKRAGKEVNLTQEARTCKCLACSSNVGIYLCSDASLPPSQIPCSRTPAKYRVVVPGNGGSEYRCAGRYGRYDRCD